MKLYRQSQALINYNSKYCQTEVSGPIVKKPKLDGTSGETTCTQTEEFMFPMDEELRRKITDLIGGRLAKYGDAYDRGSAFFTKASQMMDELEYHFLFDVDKDESMSKAEYYKMRVANGLQDPRYK